MSDAATVLMLVALQQFVLALSWLVCGRLLPTLWVTAAHWAAYGLLSAVGMLLYAAAATLPEPTRMAGNVVLVAAMLLMLRGLLLFVGRPTGDRLALAAWLG